MKGHNSLPSDGNCPSRMAEWTVSIPEDLVVELKRALAFVDLSEQTHDPDQLIFLVDTIGELKIEVFAKEHPPPHFRVSCSKGSCRFRISDGMPLDPDGLSRYFREIKTWHKEHKQDLINRWNSTRPTGCPVGEYRE
jgi:hypothetical protein